jgi:hypothetical protein
LNSHAVLGKINSLFSLEFSDEMSKKDDIEIFSSEMGVSVGGLDFEDRVLDFEDRDIEGSATKIVDCDDGIAGFVETVSKRTSILQVRLN